MTRIEPIHLTGDNGDPQDSRRNSAR
ncbi:MAG: hypothetical protein QOI83_4050, partial [Streptomycetaceae bacterium]|nr:hypothetical protein [Streptomycetaceae bacterium]